MSYLLAQKEHFAAKKFFASENIGKFNPDALVETCFHHLLCFEYPNFAKNLNRGQHGNIEF